MTLANKAASFTTQTRQRHQTAAKIELSVCPGFGDKIQPIVLLPIDQNNPHLIPKVVLLVAGFGKRDGAHPCHYWQFLSASATCTIVSDASSSALFNQRW